MPTGEDREAEHGRILLDRRLDDLRHRPADAAVDHLEAGLAGRDRDHLRAVRVAVEPGLADDDPGAAPVPRAPRRHTRAHRLDAGIRFSPVLAASRRRRRAASTSPWLRRRWVARTISSVSAAAAGSNRKSPPSAPATSGEGSPSVHRLRPTTIISPRLMRARRSAWLCTRADFM